MPPATMPRRKPSFQTGHDLYKHDLYKHDLM